MGIVVYTSLLKLFLDERDYSLDEIIEMADKRYGYSGDYSRSHIRLALALTNISLNAIEQLPNGKLHKKRDFCPNLYHMLGGPDTLLEGHYSRTNPKRRQFYIDLEKRYGKTHQRRESIKTSVNNELDNDIPF